MQYFIVMRDFGKNGRESIVNPEMTRRNMLDNVSGDPKGVLFIHEVNEYGDGQGLVASDITEDVVREVADCWARSGEAINDSQREFLELHIGVSFANQFRLEDA